MLCIDGRLISGREANDLSHAVRESRSEIVPFFSICSDEQALEPRIRSGTRCLHFWHGIFDKAADRCNVPCGACNYRTPERIEVDSWG